LKNETSLKTNCIDNVLPRRAVIMAIVELITLT